MALVQDGAFACDCTNDRLRITLVRSGFYGYDEGTRLVDADPRYDTDQGTHRFRMCLLPGHKHSDEELDKLAQGFVEPIVMIRES